MIDNRGVKVWPDGLAETFCTDSFRCRFTEQASGPVTHAADPRPCCSAVAGSGLDIMKTETLRTFDGKHGFTLAQGQ